MTDDFSLASPAGHLIMGDGSGLDGLATKDGAKALSRAVSVDTATTQLNTPSRTKNLIIESPGPRSPRRPCARPGLSGTPRRRHRSSAGLPARAPGVGADCPGGTSAAPPPGSALSGPPG